MNKILKISSIAALATMPLAMAHATTVTVDATDVIYAAGTQSGLAIPAPVGGTLPVAISVTAGNTLTFSAAGSISLDGGISHADPDGVGVFERVPTSSNTGFGSISGITAPLSGYLVGVFLAAGGPSGAAPTALDFTSTNFTSLSPLVDQTFFIGDGLTGDGTGTVQDFVVPAGATTLYLGISDAGGFNGKPSDYGDNLGAFTVTETVASTGGGVATTPELSTVTLLGTGLSALAGLAWRRRRSA
jgi:hypothetical protein